MTTHLITFATPDMERSQSLCHRSAIQNGVDGQVFNYRPYDLRRLRCYEDNKSVFDAQRGPSFWAWKPALISRTIERYCFIRNINEGDTVIYSDVGVEFINSVNYIIDRMDQDIFLFGNMYDHAHWCKRDIVEAVWPNYQKGEFHVFPLNNISCEKVGPHGGFYGRDPWFPFGKQVQASVIFFRVNGKTRAFVAEWLKWCTARVVDFFGSANNSDARYLIDDSPGFFPNHPEFQENRHDQAILTTMAYRDGIKLHWWPAQYNDGQFIYPRGDYPDEGYPVIVHHHRKRNNEWEAVA